MQIGSTGIDEVKRDWRFTWKYTRNRQPHISATTLTPTDKLGQTIKNMAINTTSDGTRVFPRQLSLHMTPHTKIVELLAQ